MEFYEILKIFNNNVVLAKKDEKEYILIDKGIGFNKRKGELINKDRFEKIFILERDIKDRFDKLILNIDEEIVGVCEEVISMISEEYEELDREIHVKLVDHIAFAIKRLKNNDEIENPFIIEIETLYNKDYEIAKKAAFMIKKRLNIEIPDGEIGFIALHINAAKNKGKVSDTLKNIYICNSVIEILEDELKVEINKQSIDYARFITHIKFAIYRIINKIPIKNELKSAIKRKYKDSYKIAQIIAKFMENELKEKVSDDEIAYMAMHVEKFKNKTLY
ncbi:PRD domain-containing protein [Caloramator australicus]|uniref:Beta-glucoside bgl operon antiterminator, BglG family n=1 Tax=Caloramator australicus RC3 TaxID=857293 RepID=G0V3T5_9CLOT|nr:PRD domain-containing protein [Caloramator australicus]CCC57775.1 Beta-glucoside bgl operon antiterminator, BglG family [Caloramator australicus RC3]